jgi:glycosyltransferase involved in cell wall biosynthesis
MGDTLAEVGPAGRRVVRLIARLNVGGPALHVMHLSAGLKRYPTLLVSGHVADGEGDLWPEVELRGVELHRLKELGRRVRPWQDLVALVKLVRLFRAERPAVVHTHTAKAGTLGRIAAVLAGVPVRVHTFHGHVFRGYFSPRMSRLVVFVERLLARLTTCVVVISESQRRELVEEFRICPPERIQVVPLGLELERFAPALLDPLRGSLRAELNAAQRPIVTIVGRLVPIKNHELFLEMARELKAAGEDCMFCVVGGGTEEERLRALAASWGLSEQVRFLGWRNDLEAIYADSDVVVLTSHNEGTPVCLIEALAAGRAVVATDVGGVRDVLGGGRLGTLTPPGDVQALVAGVRRLLASSEMRRSFEAAGPAEIPARFSIQRLRADVEHLYDSLLEPARGAVLPPTPKSTERICTT